ncbi:MAG: aminodeoxychorismate synthase component I [Candidatus Sumerlaeaceae bacterium]
MTQRPHTAAHELTLIEARLPASKLLAQACGGAFHAQGEFLFRSATDVYIAWSASEVIPILEAIESRVEAGAIAVGFLAYEAACAFDSAHAVHPLPLGWPYAVWGIFHTPPEYSTICEYAEVAIPRPARWRPLLSRVDYSRVLAILKAYIERGHTYQVNYAFPLEGSFEEVPLRIFRALQRNQPCDTAAYFDLGSLVIASASPELFFELDGDRLSTRPMKGTVPRALWPKADEAAMCLLRSSAKQQAENLMIVDLLRNDMGRVSDVGSVEVLRLFDVERYPTVWQMTSTITSRTRAPLSEIFRALFPCGSVTGAPKIRTMQIIRDLEPWPRWIYCGAIGWIAPGRKARFSVPIRTLVLDKKSATARYHVGSGVTADSDCEGEHDECLAKAQVLFTPPLPPFELLETLRYANDNFDFLAEHMARLEASARYFDFVWNPGAVERALNKFAQENRGATKPLRVRLLYGPTGQVRLEAKELHELTYPLRLALANEPVDETQVLLYHKTTQRQIYQQAIECARHAFPEVDDVLLFNRAGYLTEATIANVVVELDGQLFTPPIECGLLPGVFRSVLIASGKIRERRLSRMELRRADRLWLINSVRGWMSAVVIGNGVGSA